MNKSIRIKITESIYETVLKELVLHELGVNYKFDFGNLEYIISSISDENIKILISNNNDYFSEDNYEMPIREININKNESVTIFNMMKPRTSYEFTILEISDETPKMFI